MPAVSTEIAEPLNVTELDGVDCVHPMAGKRVHVCCACRGIAYVQYSQKAWLVGNLDQKSL